MRTELFFRVFLCSGFLVSVGCSPQPAQKFACDSPGCATACIVPGAECSADTAECCPGFSCFNGTCSCAAKHAACGAGAPTCCNGLECDPSGHCEDVCTQPRGACGPLGSACAADSDCCAPGACTNGKCALAPSSSACRVEGSACTQTSDCCGNAMLGSQMDCVAAADGGSYCHSGRPGEACDATHRCGPGLNCVAPTSMPSDAGTADGGELDAGVSPLGTCRVPTTGAECSIFTGTCNVGDRCDPDSTTNQSYDPCLLFATGNRLGYRQTPLSCVDGYCSQPQEGEACTGACRQTAGDGRRTVCRDAADGERYCMPQCTENSDCSRSDYADSNINAQPATNYCRNYGNGAACQPALCFAEGVNGLDDTSVLYKPCAQIPDSLCLPRFSQTTSGIVGFCTAVRPGTGSTVGQVCNPRAGIESPSELCGADAVCLGGRCAPICDASTLGADGKTPGCEAPLTCISPQGLDLVASYQFGGCGTPCDPFADLAHSGCVSYCGGPPTKCHWIIADPSPGAHRGYCGAALVNPLKAGEKCRSGVVDPCEAGARCLRTADGTGECTRLCDPTAVAGTPDACPSGTCKAFQGFTRSGYCE